MTGVVFWLAVSVAGILSVLIGVFLIGCLLPRDHAVSRTVNLPRSREEVWETVIDFPAMPHWHPQVLKSERLPDRDGRPLWRETYKGDLTVLLETTVAERPQRLVRTIADEKGPFNGCWEFELAATGHGCTLTITERGAIASPMIRFVARLFMDPGYYLEMYLKALATRFGQEMAVLK